MTNHIKFPSGISDERPARKESSKIQLDIAFALLLEKRKLFRENERTNALGTPKGRGRGGGGGPTAQVRREYRTEREAPLIPSYEKAWTRAFSSVRINSGYIYISTLRKRKPHPIVRVKITGATKISVFFFLVEDMLRLLITQQQDTGGGMSNWIKHDNTNTSIPPPCALPVAILRWDYWLQ